MGPASCDGILADMAEIDAGYLKKVRESFARQGLMAHLGARITELREGYVEIRASYRPELTQQHNYFHAGVSGAMADSACGYAAYSLMPVDSSVLTDEYKINLLAPAAGEELIARARAIRSGKTLTAGSADANPRTNTDEPH